MLGKEKGNYSIIFTGSRQPQLCITRYENRGTRRGLLCPYLTCKITQLNYPFRRKQTMSEEIKNQVTPSEDIDILLLIERVTLFFRKYKWVFIIAIIAGVATGISIYRSLPDVYKSRLIVHSFLLTNQEEIQIIETWNELLGKHEYAALAAIFNCQEKTVSPVKQIKGDEIQKVFSTNNPNGFLIEVTVTDISILDELQPAIVNGLENNDYVKERIALKKSTLVQAIEKTNRQIQNLDSIKKRVEDIINRNQNFPASSVTDITAINTQLLEMNDKLMGYKENLRFANSVQVLQGFSKFKQPVGPKLFVWLFLGLVPFLSLAYLYALIHSINEKLKKGQGKDNYNFY